MKIKTLITNMTLGCGILLLASCSSNADEDIITPGQVDTNFAIVPNVGLGHITATRAEGVVYPATNTNLDVSVFRIDQYDNSGTTEYPADYSTAQTSAPLAAKLVGNTTATVHTATINFDDSNKQYYLSDGKRTSVIAVHPAITSTAWTASSGKVAYAIDGKTDIMVTKLGEGRKVFVPGQATTSSQPTGMQFNHLLTQIHVRVYAVDQAAQDYWGDITAVAVQDRNNACAVAFPALTAASTPPSTDAATLTDLTGTADLSLYKVDGSAASIAKANVPLFAELKAEPYGGEGDKDPATFGYCMFAPVDPAAVLPLAITTTKNSVATTTYINVASQAYNAATAYTITLKLKAYEIIPEGVTIQEWTPETIAEIQI